MRVDHSGTESRLNPAYRHLPLAGIALAAALAGCDVEPPPPPPRVLEPFHLNGYERGFGYSQAVKVGRTVYVSATLPVDADGRLVSPGDMAGQLQAVYQNLAATLKAEGVGFGQVAVERIYTTDMTELLTLADRRLKIYPHDQLPATTFVEVKRLVDPGFLVAIEAVVELP